MRMVTRSLRILRSVMSLPPLLLAAGCATASSRAPSPDAFADTIPVSSSSMPSGYGVQVRLEGSALQRDGWLYVEMPSGSVRTYQGTTDAWDLEIRAGLATCDGKGGWKIVSESRAARVAPLIGLGRDSAAIDTTIRAFEDTLRLDLGVPRGLRLDEAWLTVEVAWPIQSVVANYTLPASGMLAARDERREARGRRAPTRPDRICRRK